MDVHNELSYGELRKEREKEASFGDLRLHLLLDG